MNRLFSRKRILTTALSGMAFLGGYLLYSHAQNSQFARAEAQREDIRAGLQRAEDLASAFRDVGKLVEPSVVNINVRKKGEAHPKLDPDLLKRFFPDGKMPPGFSPDDLEEDSPEQLGTGSGVIIENADGVGYVVTNNHVAGGAEEMVITLSDGREIKNGKLLGADPKTDLAVIKIEAEHLVAARWGNSDELQKGDWVMAFGSPFGYVGSMTHGIVSALNRTNVGILGTGGYENFIQVDAPINPGNSGGPLANLRGDVVGINTAIASRSGGFQGIGFTIPSNQARVIYQQLKEKGKVTRGWLGVGIRDVAKELETAKSFGYDQSNGVLVDQVIAGTPATGKLEHGDIITQVNSKPVRNVAELRNTIASFGPNVDVKLAVFRNKQTTEVTIKLGEQPDDVTAVNNRSKKEPGTNPDDPATLDSLGLKIQTLTDELAQKFDIADVKSGALITRVDRNSLAAKRGLRVGDVITELNRQKVKSADDLIALIKKEDLKKGVRLYVVSRDGARFVFLSTEK